MNRVALARVNQNKKHTLLLVNRCKWEFSAWRMYPIIQIEFKKLVHFSKFTKLEAGMSFVNSLANALSGSFR